MIRTCLAAFLCLAAFVGLGHTEDKTASNEKPDVVTLFEEDFKTLAIERFEQLGSGESQFDLRRGTMTINAGVQLVRPVRAGPVVQLTAVLDFPPLEHDGDTTTTVLGFVIGTKAIGLLQWSRRRENGQVTADLQVAKADAESEARTVRAFKLRSDAGNGAWVLDYRHGLIVVGQSGNAIARGYLETPDTPVIGVVWKQPAGSVTCRGMRLVGEPAKDSTPDEQQLLRQAARLNEEGIRLYREGKYVEALVPTQQASSLFQAVLGEKHHDTANSFANIANVLEKQKDYRAAQTYYEKALAVRRQILGPRHPHTALISFCLGNLLLSQGEVEEAHKYYTETVQVYEEVYGKEDSRTRSVPQIRFSPKGP